MERFRAVSMSLPKGNPQDETIEGILNQRKGLDGYDLVTVVPTTIDGYTRTAGVIAIFQRRSE